MYRDVYYDRIDKCIKMATWNRFGDRIITEHSYNPYLYVETFKKDTGIKSIFGTNLVKKEFADNIARRKFQERCGVDRLFGNIRPDQQFLLDTFSDKNKDIEFTKHPLLTWFYDIETYSPGAFPEPAEAPDPVNVITIYDSLDDKFITWGAKPLEKPIDKCEYVHCPTEGGLLESFVFYLSKRRPDILTGWNSSTFDNPYIVNRIKKVLGWHRVLDISPHKDVRSVVVNDGKGRLFDKWTFYGMSAPDYLDIYKKFSRNNQPSYKLDYIGEVELGEKKIDTGNMNLAELADTDWQKFVEYNVQDVNLLVKLDQRLRYIELLRMLAYIGLTTFDQALGTLGVVTGACAINAKKDGLIIPTFTNKEAFKFEGGYVGVPQTNFQENVGSVDANSLYPNVVITLNISPETKIGKIVNKQDGDVIIKSANGQNLKIPETDLVDFIRNEKIAVSKSKVLFSQKKKGVLPSFIDELYDDRKMYQRKKAEEEDRLETLEKGSPEYDECKILINRYDIRQYTIKICLNSAYGYFGNQYAPMGDVDIAQSITSTGQACIKKSNEILRNYIQKEANMTGAKKADPVIYNDTDSSYVTITPIMKHKGIEFLGDDGEINPRVYEEFEKLEDHLNIEINKWSKASLFSLDSRFKFKREKICKNALFLAKKRYVLHVMDNEGRKVDKISYTGVEVARTALNKHIKSLIKEVVEEMLNSKNVGSANDIFLATFEKFKQLDLNDLAFISGINNYNKYADQCDGFNTVKSMPIHVKASYFHNKLLEKYNITNKYERINSGDKVRYFYVKTPNKYNISVLGYKFYFPEEWLNDFEIDIDFMFEKTVYAAVERYYKCVSWNLRKPNEQLQTNLFNLLGF